MTDATQELLFGQQSENIDLISSALVIAQAQMDTAKKEATNKYLNDHKYADLATIREVIRKPFEDNGLAVTQYMSVIFLNGTVQTGLVTKLLHKSGQWMAGVMPLFLTKQDPQGQGSAITYARRYCLAAIAGVVTEDDDAVATTKKPSGAPKPDPQLRDSEFQAGAVSQDSWDQLISLATENKWHDGYVRQWIRDQGKKGTPETEVYIKASEKFGEINRKAED